MTDLGFDSPFDDSPFEDTFTSAPAVTPVAAVPAPSAGYQNFPTPQTAPYQPPIQQQPTQPSFRMFRTRQWFIFDEYYADDFYGQPNQPNRNLWLSIQPQSAALLLLVRKLPHLTLFYAPCFSLSFLRILKKRFQRCLQEVLSSFCFFFGEASASRFGGILGPLLQFNISHSELMLLTMVVANSLHFFNCSTRKRRLEGSEGSRRTHVLLQQSYQRNIMEKASWIW
jgi:hypothetical protein